MKLMRRADMAFILNIIVAAYTGSIEELVEVTNMTGWYNPLAQCMLTPRKTSTPYLHMYDDCVQNMPDVKYSTGKIKAFPSLSTETSPFVYDKNDHNHCCNEEVHIRERGFLQGFKKFSDPFQKPVLTFLRYLDNINKSLILLGDSTSSQMFHALFHELDREDPSSKPTDITADFKATYNQTISSDLDPVYAVFQWNSVKIYDIKLLSFDIEKRHIDDHVKNTLFPRLLIFCPNESYIIANIGHHLKSLNEQKHRKVLVERMGHFLSWITEVSNASRGHVIYRETPPGHFNSVDGTYENGSPIDWREPNSWDSHIPLYHCRMISENATNRAENKIIWNLIHLRGLQIHWLEVFRYFAPYYKMHYGSCRAPLDERWHKLDCVHLCSFLPHMWMPLWTQLQSIIVPSTNKFVQSVAPSLTSISNATKDIVISASIAAPKTFIKLLSKCSQNLCSTASYFSQEGILHELPDRETEEFVSRRWLEVHKTILPTINIAVEAATAFSADSMSKYGEIGESFISIVSIVPTDETDKTTLMLKQHDDKEVYAIGSNSVSSGPKKARIPSWEVFESMVGEVIEVPHHQLDLIEEMEFKREDFARGLGRV